MANAEMPESELGISRAPAPEQSSSAGNRWQVFLSSTFREAEAYRGAVTERCEQQLSDRIDLVALDKSEFSRISIDPKTLSIESVVPCDLVLLLMGHELGSRSAQGESFTEAEFRTAHRNGIPVIAFLLDEGAQDLSPGSATGPGAAEEQHGDRERQRQFREDVRAYATLVEGPRVPLGTTDQLADEVIKKLNEWLQFHARPHMLTEPDHPNTIFVGRDEPYRQLKRRVLAGQPSVVSGASGVGKSTLVEAICEDRDIKREYPRPAVIKAFDLGDTAATFEPSKFALMHDSPPGTRDLLIVRISSVLDPQKDLEQEVANFISSFPTEKVLARRCTMIFELTDDAAAKRICERFGDTTGARTQIRLEGLNLEDSLALLLVNKGLHEDCPTCARYGPRVAEAAGHWPPLLDLCARSFASAGDRDDQHEYLMGYANEAFIELRPGQDQRYETFRRERDSLPADPQHLLDAVGVLLPEPFGFSLDLIATVVGLRKSAAKRALKTLVSRGYINPGGARRGSAGSAGSTKAEYLIHPFFWAFLQPPPENTPGADGGTEKTKQLREAAFDWLQDQVNETVEDELTYGGWSKLEKPDRQGLLANWIYQLAHADDRREAAEALARIYLKALWWWGAYLPFDFCDLLIELGYKALTWSSPTTEAEDDDLHQVVRWLDRLNDSYLRLGQLFDAPPKAATARTAWDQTSQALRGLARRLEVPVDDEVAAVKQWVPPAGPTDEETAQKATRLRDIAMFVHAFLADCEQCWYGEKAIDDRRLAEVERHLRSAVAISKVQGDDWNRPWFWFFLGDAEIIAARVRHESPAGYHRQEAACLKKARSYAEKALTGARKVGKKDENDLDFEVLANSERLLGDVDWQLGHRTEAIEHYARAVHYAHCFELWPDHQPDLYTRTFEREQCQCVVTPLSELASTGGADEVRGLADRFAAFFGAVFKAPTSPDRAEGWAETLRDTLFLPYHLPSRGDLPRQDQRAELTIERFREQEREMIRSVEGRHPDLVRLPDPDR